MSSVYYGGSVRMNPEVENENLDPMFDEGYPYKMPKVYLEGCGESYFPQWCFNWDDDSVVVVRDKHVVKYTRSSFLELLAKNEAGEIVWMDGRSAPYSSCWEGEYLDEDRGAQEYTVEEYDLKSYKKKKYKVVLHEEYDLDAIDYRSLSKFVDAETLGSHFKIENGVLLRYVGDCADLIIPDGVTEIAAGSFVGCEKFNSVVIPSTVTKISCGFCQTNRLEVAKDNPKYYIYEGCLIDKEEKELVWAYSGSDIPDDGSVEKIGSQAFAWRSDLKSIVIPDAITEIGDDAFSDCHALKEISLPAAFVEDSKRIFGRALVVDGDKWTLEPVKFFGFSF